MNSKIRLLIISLMIFGSLAFSHLSAMADEGPELPRKEANAETNLPEYVPGQLIVKLKEGKALEDINELNEKYKISSIEQVFKEAPFSEDTLKQLKGKLANLSEEHQSWYWQLDKDSQEYKEYIAKIEKERQSLEQQIQEQEEFLTHLEQRQKRAPVGETPPDLKSIYLLKISDNSDIPSLAEEYASNPNVEYAEPNYRVKIQAFPQTLPNDTYVDQDQNGTWSTGEWGQPYEDMWGLKKIQADKAWPISQGEGIIVAVVDTGIDYTHEDINSNIWINTQEIPDNGIDDDNNGYIDDVKGWDFTTCGAFDMFSQCFTPKSPDNDPMDGHGHGTHVAGTIAAAGNNSKGIIGVAPEAKVMAIKGLNDSGQGTSLELSDCLRYAADNGADVINNSWGGPGTSQLITDAVSYAYSKGCVVVAAAGNDTLDTFNFRPANINKVIAVASTDINDRASDFSNFGYKVDVAAPGGDSWDNSPNYMYANILSLRAGQTDMYGDGASIVGTGYYRARGTSMAAPHVTGACALLLAKNPQLTQEEVRQLLKTGSDKVLGDERFDNAVGRLNVRSALGLTQVCNAIITSPSGPFQEVYGTINITGAASGETFREYIISLTAVGNPDLAGPYVLYTSYAQVNNGVLLSNFDTSRFPDGDYLMLLEVRDAVNNSYKFYQSLNIKNTYISSPKELDLIPLDKSKIIEIRGRIAGDSFASYELSYLAPGNSQSYATNGVILNNAGRAKVDDGVLATVDLSQIQLPEDNNYSRPYAFRLAAHYNRFPFAEDYSDFKIYLDPTIRPGWPINFAPLNNSTPWFKPIMLNTLTLADVDGNGKDEVLLNYGGRVHVFTDTGFELTGWPKTVASEFSTSQYGVCAADLDRDGKAEVIAADNDGYVSIFHSDGSIYRGWDRKAMGGGLCNLTLSDLNNDGQAEIIMTSFIASIIQINDLNGEILSGWPKSLGTYRQDFISKAAVGDINKDGSGEIIVTTFNFSTKRITIYAFNYRGELLIGWPQEVSDLAAPEGVASIIGNLPPLLCDLDNDGDLEIVATGDGASRVWAFNGNGSLVSGWPKDVPYGIYTIPAIGDIDSDGKKEVVVGVEHVTGTPGYFYGIFAFKNNGELLPGFPIELSLNDFYFPGHGGLNGQGVGSFSIGDINGDGKQEIIANWGGPFILAYNSSGSMVSGFPKYIKSGLGGMNSPAIGDLDGDGNAELALVNGMNEILVWNLPAKYDSKKLDWPMFQHDPQHTGNSNATFKPPLTGTITPSIGTSGPNQSVNFTTTYSDPDGWQNIQYVYFLLDSSKDGKDCFFGYYNQNNQKLYLRNDTNTAWLGGFLAGSNNIIENSFARLDCSQTTAQGSGNTLTVNWVVTLKPLLTGTKNAYLYVKDDAGLYDGWVKKGAWSLSNQAPSVGTITPSSGTGQIGAPQTFSATYSDPDGWQNIQSVYLLINETTNGTNSFYAYYNRQTNKLYLKNDANTSWQGGFSPGSANTIENSYAKLGCSQTTAQGSGNTLTVNWSVTFKSPFTGLKNIYLAVKDDVNAPLSLAKAGTWSLPNQAPYVSGFSGENYIPLNQPVSFFSIYTDPDGWQNIQYVYFLLDSSTDGINSFFGYYNQNNQKLYLRNDTNTAWLGGFLAGSNNIIENSYVKLDCSQTDVSGSEDRLVVNWAATFKPPFAGTKNAYLYVKDDAGQYNGWVETGTFPIGN